MRLERGWVRHRSHSLRLRSVSKVCELNYVLRQDVWKVTAPEVPGVRGKGKKAKITDHNAMESKLHPPSLKEKRKVNSFTN